MAVLFHFGDTVQNPTNISRHAWMGTVFIVVAGSLLHFTFEWTGSWRAVAVIAAVNESIWEHLKLAFWPGVFWALLPGPLPLRDRLAIKGYTLALASVLIVWVFTSYTWILGDNYLALDIGTFIVAVAVAQATGPALSRHMTPLLHRIGLGILAGQLVAFCLLTYFAPEHWLFIDSRNGLTGLAASQF